MATNTTSKPTAPFDAWPSPVSTELVLSSAVTLAEAHAAPGKDAVAWLEGRPQEKGRNALVYQRIDADGQQVGEAEEVLADTKWNARSRVHEYGGGSWAFEADGAIVFSSVEGPVYRVKRSEDGKWSEPEQITPKSDVLRFADFAPHPSQPGLSLAVAEDHTDDAPSAVVNSLVLLSGSPSSPVLTTVASGNDFYSAPRWSPSAKYLAWIEWSHPNMPWEQSELWVAKLSRGADGKVDAAKPLVEGSAKKVAGGADVSISQPRWALEDDRLIFLSDESGFYELFAFEPEAGKDPAPLLDKPAGADIGGPDWIFAQSTHGALSPSSWISAAPKASLRLTSLSDGSSSILSSPYAAFDGFEVLSPTKLLTIGKPAAAPAAVSILTLPAEAGAGVVEQVLKRSSTASVDPAFIPVGEEFTFPVSTNPDQSGVGHALYYAPSSGSHTATDGALPPLIARCHGGPTAAARRGLDWLVAFFCSRGFAFVDVDYGGSTGYGKTYRRRLEGLWGLVDVQDTIDCVEFLVKEGKVDKDKVAITGGSAGGFTVLAALCDSKVFTAGTSSYGISSLNALAEDTHKFESQYLFKLIGGTPEEVPQNYHDRSPLNKSSQITAPLLLLQGDQDRVVPPAQSSLMLERIREQGGVCEMELFEGEGHGFRGREARERAMKKELDWYRRTWGIKGVEGEANS
ncbi:hypothetical protein JCM10213_001524 [Rhodosporidiobolus nylandii]